MNKILLIVSLLVGGCSLHSTAQIVSNDHTRERNFLREVKVIDEFIERFNDDPASFIRQEYKKAQRPFPLSRMDLVNSLFNYGNQALVANTTKMKFVQQVTDREHPQRLGFNRDNWYAEAQCVFNYNKHEVTVPLILRIIVDESKSSKWMIANVGNTTAFDSYQHNDALNEGADNKGRYFISPSSCATNFLELHQVLKSDINPANFFTPEQLKDATVIKMVGLLKSNQLTFNRVKNLRFHFYQIPNYVFTVEQFIRSESNSGWLINELEYVTDEQKSQQKQNLLK